MSLKLHYSKLCGLSCVEPCSTTEKSVAWQRKKLNTRHKCVCSIPPDPDQPHLAKTVNTVGKNSQTKTSTIIDR